MDFAEAELNRLSQLYISSLPCCFRVRKALFLLGIKKNRLYVEIYDQVRNCVTGLQKCIKIFFFPNQVPQNKGKKLDNKYTN